MVRRESMSVVSEALEFLGLSTRARPDGLREEFTLPRTRTEQRALAATMRRLPARFVGRLPARTLEGVQRIASRGRWEQALDKLLSALHTNGTPLTHEDAMQLRTVLHALQMSDEPMAGMSYQ
jgi:hypothetical protein